MSADIFGSIEFGNLDVATSNMILIFLIVYLVALVVAMTASVVMYVFQSLGVYTIAKRRGIHHPWLAWIPVGSAWILGSISDQYQYVVKGKIRSRRRVLLGLYIALYVVMLVALATVVAMAIAAVETETASGMISPSLGYFAVMGVSWVLSVITTVFVYIAYYDLFVSCSSNHAVLFLVLSIFFNFLLPFFVFYCRKKDEGMPPRKIQVPVAPWTPAPPPPAWQPPAEPVREEEPASAEETTEE